MKKKILLVLTILLLTGCKYEANYHFTENGVSSNIDAEFTKTEFKQNSIKLTDLNRDYLESNLEGTLKNYYDNKKIYATNAKQYNSSIYKNGETYILKFNYDFTYDEFNNNNYQLKNCFDNFIVTQNGEETTYEIQGTNKCIFTPKLIISSDLNVVSNNATGFKDGKYIWNVKAYNNDIKFTISKKPANDSIMGHPVIDTLRIILLVVYAICGLIAFMFYRKNR